jgi:hypothetical protein
MALINGTINKITYVIIIYLFTLVMLILDPYATISKVIF